MKCHPELVEGTTDCHTEPVEVLLNKGIMIQGAVTPVKHRCYAQFIGKPLIIFYYIVL